MDFNPLDILAAAALGEKDAPPEINDPGADQPKSPGQTECTSNIEAQDVKEADDDTTPEMGKSGSNSLKHRQKPEETETIMAPQKIPWSPDSFLNLTPDSHSVQTNDFCLNDIVKDFKSKSLDMELKNIIGKTFPTDTCLKHSLIDSPHVGSLKDGQNNNLVSTKNEINCALNEEPSKLALEADGDADADKTKEKDITSIPIVADDKSVDSGVSGGECSPESEYQYEPWTLDHPYAMTQGHSRPHLSLDNDDIDVCSDLSPLAEDSEQRSRNMALDCNYLKSGIMEGASASTLDLYGVACSLGRSKLPSSSSSASSPTTDLGSRSSKVDSSENCNQFTEPGASTSPNNTSASPNKAGTKFGKFKIGTFASFSSSNLELEKYLRNQDPTTPNHRKLNVGIPSEPHAVESTLSSPTVQPLLQSPSLDWDRSEAGSETQDDSSDNKTPQRLSPDFTSEKVTEWSHPLFHDHDYCTKDEYCAKSDNFKKLTTAKRKYTKRKSKLDLVNHEKIMKAKYLKKELLKQDNFLKSSVESEQIQEDNSKTNPVGRPRKKPVEKVVEEEIDPETGTKMKITGKFQDQYVYYLSKSSRTTTRRRQTSAGPLFPDKIIVPAPKPGDIVVHHLTDTDIETVRLKGRSALNLPERPHHTNSLPTSTASSSLSTPCPPCPSQSNDTISDVDIVSTILSMENDNLSSPTTSNAPTTDLSSTAGINPHQPALTESLRQLSGDSTLSSEHVLNYLLNVVKDEQLLGNGNGFDTSTTALFPTIPPDSIYSKADNTEFGSVYTPASFPSGSLGQDPVDKSVPLSSSADVTNSQFQGSYQYVQSAHRNQIDDSVSLPDDFPSLISNSQESSSNCSQHDVDSHGSLKSVFGSDVSSLGTPQLSSSVPRLTSIEKTLDYLGVKDGEIKLEGGGFSNPFGVSLPLNEETQSACTPDQQIDETPWIVTVTLYFNDVPAIMVNSAPFIRLVDIHKQILPAKDTGILKKRCQLLNIPVLNCNEMQRYFLVQYGRAYNSKSTLIISKDQATKLVTYYATPQPRLGKVEDTVQRRPSSCGSDSGTRSPVTCPQSGVLKRKGLPNPKTLKKTDGLIIGSPTGFGDKFQSLKGSKDESEASQTKRTRHKKVNYLEMLKGEEKIPSEDSILETIEAVVKSAPDFVRAEKIGSKKKKSKKSRRDESTHEKRVKGSKSKSSSKKKHDKTSRKHGRKERHSSTSRKHSSKSLTTEHPLLKHASAGFIDSDAGMDHSQKKFKPLKLKVHSLLNFAGNKRPASSPSSTSPSPAKKAGLFSRSNSLVSPSSPVTASPIAPTAVSAPHLVTAHHSSPRILAVAHQAASALPSGESRLPSQPADIHLDLFTRPSSACVRCRTCSQFLSVPHFMRHHHVPMDSQWLASEAAHRILVPLASSDATDKKVGMSERERRLWEDFHRLQEAIGGFGEGDDESDSDVDFAEDEEDGGDEEIEEEEEEENDNDQDEVDVNDSGMNTKLQTALISEASTMSSPGNVSSRVGVINGSNTHKNLQGHPLKMAELSSHTDAPVSNNSVQAKKKIQPSEASLAKAGLVRREPPVTGNNQMHSQIVSSEHLGGHVRHSSRRRKSKQFFSIENYDTVPQKSLDNCHAHSSAPYG